MDRLEIDSHEVVFCSNTQLIKVIPHDSNQWFYPSDVYQNIYEKLFEWHFDVFNLIEAGIAIDVNTVK